MADVEVKSVESPVSEEDRRIEGYHKMLHSLFKSESDIITAQSVASFMGCIMAHSEEWQRVIPGFVKQMLDYANVALAAHRMAAEIETPNQETSSGSSAEETKE